MSLENFHLSWLDFLIFPCFCCCIIFEYSFDSSGFNRLYYFYEIYSKYIYNSNISWENYVEKYFHCWMWFVNTSRSQETAREVMFFHSFTSNFHVFISLATCTVSLTCCRKGEIIRNSKQFLWLSELTRSRRLFTCSNSRYTRGFISYDLWTYLQSVSIGYQHAGSRYSKQRSCDWERALSIR